MSTATVTPARRPSNKVTRSERRGYLAQFRLRGWSQNEAARQIGKDPGLFSRWLRGELTSSIIRVKVHEVLTNGLG
jgi:hypothetical protein